MQATNVYFLPKWRSFSSRCHCEVVNTKSEPPNWFVGCWVGYRAPLAWPGEGPVAHHPHGEKPWLVPHPDTHHMQPKKCLGRGSHRPCPAPGGGGLGTVLSHLVHALLLQQLHELGSMTVWNTWSPRQDEFLQALVAGPTFSSLVSCSVRKSLIWPLQDWFSKAKLFDAVTI